MAKSSYFFSQMLSKSHHITHLWSTPPGGPWWTKPFLSAASAQESSILLRGFGSGQPYGWRFSNCSKYLPHQFFSGSKLFQISFQEEHHLYPQTGDFSFDYGRVSEMSLETTLSRCLVHQNMDVSFWRIFHWNSWTLLTTQDWWRNLKK